MTVPDTLYDECWHSRGDKQYVNRMNEHLRSERKCSTGSNIGQPCFVDSDCPGSGTCSRTYRYVVDTAREIAKYSKADTMLDWVHGNFYWAELAGNRVGEWLAGWGACALDAGGPEQRPQRYCRYSNDAWSSTTCTMETDAEVCGALGAVCQVRECSVAGDCPDAGDSCNVVS
jgi:hypothetical protein